MKNKIRSTIAAAAVFTLMLGAVASAQTTSTTPTTPATVQTTADQTTANQTTVGSSTTPGVPNTGLGGDALSNWLLLGVTGLIALSGVAFLARRPRETDSQ